MKNNEIDLIDTQILEILQENCRTSYREIKDQLGISIGTIHNRISKMKDSGIIKKYTLILDDIKLGYKLTLIIHITIKGAFIKEILNELEQKREVCSIYHIAGKDTALLICKFKDIVDSHSFILEMNNDDNIEISQSNIVLKEHKNTRSVEV